jgi:hypothetical protein
MSDELPTARTMATTGFRWHVFCKSCQWAIDTDFQQLIADGRSDVPLAELRWRCERCATLADQQAGTLAAVDRADWGRSGGEDVRPWV